jgi:type 2 lantibiotic biosynthesis protein LanM
MHHAFDAVLARLVEPALQRLADRLAAVPGLATAEREAVHASASAALWESVRHRTIRALVLELNVARIGGRLTAPSPRERWEQWLESATSPGFWDSLGEHYPTLVGRLGFVMENRCAATTALATRFAADRTALGALRNLDGPAGPVGRRSIGELVAVRLGAGDSHRGGQAVATLTCTGGQVVYKPRSVAVDAELDRTLPLLLPPRTTGARIRVPLVLDRGPYGWAEHVAHRLCDGDAELREHHRNLGHWLAVMRLLGGSDLHSENVIAVGPVPVVVDCEALFTPPSQVPVSGYGLAVDRASRLVNGSVLRTGLLPRPRTGLGWRGVDLSGVGRPSSAAATVPEPVLLDAGTDLARVGVRNVAVRPDANRPSADAVLSRYWEVLLDGFVELTGHLHALDRAGRMEGLVAGFADLPVRMVLRGTDTYAEIAHMLWHPSALHDQDAAVRRAADLLTRQAANNPGSPDDPAVVGAEIADLLEGDIPVFTTTPGHGRMDGPRGTRWGPVTDLVADALRDWRGADPNLDGEAVRATLVSGYLNQGERSHRDRVSVHRPRPGRIDARRRRLAARLVRALAAGAVHGDDGTVTWIAPVYTAVGWIVQPLTADMYSGLSGVAVALAGYRHEVSAGRADEVAGLDGLLDAVVRTLRVAHDRSWAEHRSDLRVRPEPPGGYVGAGSRIWAWLLLEDLGVGGFLDRAAVLAEQLPDAVRADDKYDLLIGMAGAVVPLLRLGERTGDHRWPAMALRIARRLGDAAVLTDGAARWPGAQFPDGIGGLSHGTAGIGWALTRVAQGAPGALADAAFEFDERLYDPARGGWRDLRTADELMTAWCHGAGGLGVVALDLLAAGTGPADGDRWAHVVRRAAADCWTHGMDGNHTLCHGALGNWEVVAGALDAGLGPAGLGRDELDAHVITGLEEFGPTCGIAGDTPEPGLMTGVSGIAYQLLRLHPDCPLPSVLLPDPLWHKGSGVR